MAKNKKMQAIVEIAGVVSPTLAKSIGKTEKLLGGGKLKTLAIGASITTAALAVTKAAVNEMKALYDIGVQFDKVEDSIRIGTGATGEALDALMGDFNAVYSSVPTTMEQASQAIADYNTRLDVTGDTLQGLSEDALNVANMLGEDVGAVVESTSQSFQAFNLSSDEMGDAMDYLFKVTQSTGIGFTELAGDVQKNGAVMQQLGFSYEETAALLGQFQKSGYDTSKVTSAMAQATKNAAKLGLSGADAYATYYDAIKNATTETEAINKATELFGGKGGAIMASAIRDGTLDLKAFTAQLDTSSESIETAAWDTYDLSQKMQVLKQRGQVALQPLAESMFDLANDAFPIIEQIFEGGLIPAIQDLTTELLPIIQNILPTLGPLVEQLVPAVSEILGAVLLLLPPAAEIFLGLLPFALDIINLLVPVIQTVIPIIDEVMEVVALLLPFAEQLVQLVLPTLVKLLGIVAPLLEALLPIIQPLLELTMQLLQPVLDFADALAEGVVIAIDAVMPYLDWFIAQLSEVINFLVNVFQGNWSAAWDNIVAYFSRLWDGLVGIVKAPINGIIDVLNWFTSKLNGISFTLPDIAILGEYRGLTIGFDIPEIPHLAVGGFTTGPSLAGEAGTEAVISFDPRYRLANLQTWATAGQMLTGTDSVSAAAGKLLGLDDFSLEGLAGDTYIYYDFSGITFAPVIQGDGVDADDIMGKLRKHEEEFFAWLEEFARQKEAAVYA